MALTRADVRQMVWDEARRQGVNPALAVKLAWAESRFNPDARSPAGAIGTMQLMPGTAQDLKVDPEDVAGNIRGGITYLKQQLARFRGRAGPGAGGLQCGARGGAEVWRRAPVQGDAALCPDDLRRGGAPTLRTA